MVIGQVFFIVNGRIVAMDTLAGDRWQRTPLGEWQCTVHVAASLGGQINSRAHCTVAIHFIVRDRTKQQHRMCINF